MNENESEIKRIYLDTAAATPLSLAVKEAMLPYLDTYYGNASAIHEEGRRARAAVEESRQSIATTLGGRPDEVVFTGSGTEANNLAVLGYVQALKKTGRPYETMTVVMTEIEHPSLLNLVPVLQTLGVTVTYVPVTEDGLVTKAALEETLTKETVLVTFSYVNSEIGTVQPVLRLAKTVHEYARGHGIDIKVHVDGAQAPLWLPCQIAQLGVDSLTLDAGKCYGPKGVGVLYTKHKSMTNPLISGGGQESGVRPGTENVAGIVGAAIAVKLAQAICKERSAQVEDVRKVGLAYLERELPEACLNGSLISRVANNINLSLPGIDTEYAVVWLDAHGIAASTKSACAGAGGGLSHVVFACTKDVARAKSTIRLSLSETTTTEDMRRAIDVLQDFYQKNVGLTH
jgi:cysteine desulfurase